METNDMRRLRILVVLPLYGGSLPVARFCVAALRELGHTAEPFEAPDFYSAYQALSRLKVTSDRLGYLQNSYLQTVSSAVQAKVESFEPDLVLALAQAPLTHQTLKRLKRDGVPTAMWFVEDFRLFTYWQSFAPFYDLFAVIQKSVFLEQLEAVGQPNALYLPLACHPDVHRPLELTPGERRKFGSKLSFMGAGYPNRRMAFRRFVGRDFKIWGTEWEGDHILEPLVQLSGARISSEDCVKIFNATDVNLNLHSSIQADRIVTGGDFVNPRTFELAGCGAFQVVDHRQLLPELFAPDELAVFHSVEEMVEMVDYYQGRPEERLDMARRSRKRALAEHTYAARMQALMEFAAERLNGWPKPKAAVGALADLPEDLARGVSALLERLNLPADASFEDAAHAVRSRSGILSELETTVLFLDEWRKQYG
ncbi:MAG: spore maturation protein CgeB [Desulfovibrionales bacterium]|nr:spore maturation protein CgeB [Desulfovibrionales bacterium]